MLAAAQRFAEASEAYELAASLRPEEVQHIVSAAGACSKTDDHERTAALYRRAVKLAPENVTLVYTFARCLRRASKLDESVEQYRAVLAIEPSHEAANFWLAVVRKS